MKFKRQRLEEAPINLTPLIDVVFLLLIFFMVSTTFTRESRLSLTLPEATGEPVAETARPLELIIDANGHYSIDGRPLTSPDVETLKRALDEMAEGEPGQTLVITADASTPHQAVIRAMDAAGQLGLFNLSLSTREPVEDGEGER